MKEKLSDIYVNERMNVFNSSHFLYTLKMNFTALKCVSFLVDLQWYEFSVFFSP